jgi:hypothetical protein
MKQGKHQIFGWLEAKTVALLVRKHIRKKKSWENGRPPCLGRSPLRGRPDIALAIYIK